MTLLSTQSAVTEAAPSADVEQANRPREEMNALMMGFGTGLLIGVFFLIYIVIAISHVGG